MEVQTIPDCIYTVTTTGECTVVSKVNGVTYRLAHIKGGGQATFQAIAESAGVSDDAADVRIMQLAFPVHHRHGGMCKKVTTTGIAAGNGQGFEKTRIRFGSHFKARLGGNNLKCVKVLSRSSGVMSPCLLEVSTTKEFSEGTVERSREAVAQRAGKWCAWEFAGTLDIGSAAELYLRFVDSSGAELNPQCCIWSPQEDEDDCIFFQLDPYGGISVWLSATPCMSIETV